MQPKGETWIESGFGFYVTLCRSSGKEAVFGFGIVALRRRPGAVGGWWSRDLREAPLGFSCAHERELAWNSGRARL